MRFLAALVKKPIDHIEIQLEAGKPAYTLSTDTIIMTTAYYGDLSMSGDVKPLQQVTEETLKELFPGWLDENTKARGTPRYVVLIDRRTVLLYPTPDAAAAASGKKLHLGYVYQPANLSAESDEPDLPIVYHDLVSKYAAHLCWMSKLNRIDLGVAMLNEITSLAKKHEDLIVKDTINLGFTWGSFINPEDDGVMSVNP